MRVWLKKVDLSKKVSLEENKQKKREREKKSEKEERITKETNEATTEKKKTLHSLNHTINSYDKMEQLKKKLIDWSYVKYFLSVIKI